MIMNDEEMQFEPSRCYESSKYFNKMPIIVVMIYRDLYENNNENYTYIFHVRIIINRIWASIQQTIKELFFILLFIRNY